VIREFIGQAIRLVLPSLNQDAVNQKKSQLQATVRNTLALESSGIITIQFHRSARNEGPSEILAPIGTGVRVR
jgi:hypothetical protein